MLAVVVQRPRVCRSRRRWGTLALLALCAAAGCQDILGGSRGSAPELIWRTVHEPRFGPADHPPATDGARVYATPGGMVAYDAATGRIVWTRGLTYTIPRNVLVRDGRVLAAEGVAFALDAATGADVWRFDHDGHSAFSESAADEHAFYIGTDTHRVYALDQSNGSVFWSTDIGPGWQFKGIVTGLSVSGDTVYASAEQFNAENGYISTGWIFGLNRATGAVIWSFRNGNGTDWRTVFGSPTIAGRLLLASDLRGGSFFAVDRFSGHEVWRVEGPPDKFGPNQAPMVIGTAAYVASADNFVYAVDVQTGKIIWKTKTPASNQGFAVCGDRIFVTWLGLSVLDRRTGRTLYQQDEEATEYPTSGFAVHGDRVFVLGNRAAYAYRCR